MPADARYCSADNLDAAARFTGTCGKRERGFTGRGLPTNDINDTSSFPSA